MSFLEDTVSPEQIALKMMSNSSEEAKRFFSLNYDYRDAESLDDVLCFVGYKRISLQARHADDGELEHLAKQAKIFRPLLERGTKIEAELVEFLNDFVEGKPHPILRFVLYGDEGNPPPIESIRIEKESAYKWAKEKYSIDIPEWTPSLHSKETDTSSANDNSDKNYSSDGTSSRKMVDSAAGDAEDTEATILLLTLAWFLDTFMEIQVEDWKKVMRDEKRTSGQAWFRTCKLNISKVVKKITPEYEEECLSETKIHIHITAARKVILNRWSISNPLKPGEKRAVYRTLRALSRAAVRAMTDRPNVHAVFEDLIKIRKTYLKLLDEANPKPPCLTLQQIEICLSKF